MLGFPYAVRRWSSPDILNSPQDSLVAILKDPHRYVGLVEKTALERYVMLAATVIALWDWLTRMDMEISHIWTPGFRLGGSTLYLFIRYSGMAFQAFDCAQLFGIWGAKFCTAYYFFLPVSTALLIYAVDMLLAYRALCLYRLKRPLVLLTCALFVLSVLAWAILSFMAYGGFKAIPTPRYLTGCWSLMGGFIFFSLLPAMLFEFWLFVLVVYRVLSWSQAIGWSRKGLAGLLFRDSINWFFVIQAMIIWNGLCFGVFPPGLRLLAIAPFRVAITICGSRLIINMRQAASAHISGSPMHASINRTIDGRPNGPEEPPASADHAEVPPPGAAPWLHLAKRIGLPPPLQADFEDPWYQPVMTLNVITQTVDHPAEAPRALPHPPPGMVWNSSRQPFNLSWSMAEPNRTVSLADESLAFRSVDSTQASGKASFFDVDDEVEASPVAFARARRNVLNV